MKHQRLLAALVVLVLTLTGCTGSGSGDEDTTGETTTTVASSTTTTTEPPIILALSPNLGLLPEQCWAALPGADDQVAAEDSEAATAPDTDSTDSTDTEDTTADTATAVTAPRPPTVAVVACEGTHDGVAFAGFCLAEDLESDDARLTAGPCDVESELEWPGDRALRRASARICLQRFEETFGERYSDSELVAREFVPTESVWNRGDRRVVCTVDR